VNTVQIWFLPIVGGFLLDLVLGDPPVLYHPVRLVGRLISLLERVLRRVFPETPNGERAAGVLLALVVPFVVFCACAAVLAFAARLGLYVWLAAEAWMCYRLLAVRSLETESMSVYLHLAGHDLPGARKALSRIVGRDTDALDEAQAIKATVETVAENASDGVAAPLFYMVLGGAALGWFYKAVNTLDSMTGYKNVRYRYLGTASARLDDLLNCLPSRLAALLMVVAATPAGLDSKAAFHIWRRDRRNHPSPNSAQTESACAGALGIQLAGGASYFGVWKHKPTIGDDTRPPTPEDIVRANRLMLWTSLLFLAVCCGVKAAILAIFR